MDNKELKAKLIEMRNVIQDYLDNMNIEAAEDKPAKKEKKKEEKDG